MPAFLKNVNWTTVLVAVVIVILIDTLFLDKMR